MLASSRLKPVPLISTSYMKWHWRNATFVGLALAGKALASRCKIEGVHADVFPAEAGPTEKHRVHPVGLAERDIASPGGLAERDLCGTGFSRESVGRRAARLRVCMLASSPLKPVPLKKASRTPEGLAERDLCGTGFSRESVGCHAEKMKVCMLASSRLKPVPLNSIAYTKGTG